MLDQHQRAPRGLRIRIEGSVQGVGFRPWVHGLACRQTIGGRVWNEPGCVTIEAFADDAALEGFVESLRAPPMPAARIRSLRSEPIPGESVAGFAIVSSRTNDDKRPSIPPDLATCPDCLREIHDPADRRYGYAFTNCTRCGPRYTIALDVPYDRERTTMAGFRMCDACRAEYEDVEDRRFHAQPNACPDCGPHLSLCDGRGAPIHGDPIAETVNMLRRGAIVAIKGIGGYHLACDARSDVTVARLRSLKRRYARPFAVMVASLADAESLASLGDAERELLSSPARPIVLAPRRAGCRLSEGVAAGTPLVGVLLPYTPLHELLLAAFGGPLVMTSGNISDEPMVTDDAEAFATLAGNVAQAMLTHDRVIAARCDDSVVRVLDERPVVLRRGRGLVPESLRVTRAFPEPVLACGAHLKNTFCLGDRDLAWMGPHVGDLETDEACAGFEEAVKRFSRFVGVDAGVIAHDLHPDYFSTRWAQSRDDCTRVAVQHHHAHVASAMAEHEIEGPVLGLAWDGTGDGGDGSAWGGELLAADFAGFDRIATMRPVALAGGDSAIRGVWRIALALLDDAFDGEPPVDELSVFDPIPRSSVGVVRRMIATSLHVPRAHGVGRYFDAIGALVLGKAFSRYEGEVAAALGFAADPCEHRGYGFGVSRAPGSGPATFDLRPAVRELVGDLLAGTRAATVAGRFHSTMADVADEMIALGSRSFGALPVVLTGGCFQNDRLLRDVSARLSPRTRVLRHAKVPPNDAGIALGQALIAAAAIRGEPSALGEGAVRAQVH